MTFLLATQDHQDQALPDHHRAGEETPYLLPPISLMVGFITDDLLTYSINVVTSSDCFQCYMITKGITIPSIPTRELLKPTPYLNLDHSQLQLEKLSHLIHLDENKRPSYLSKSWRVIRAFFSFFCVDKVLPDASIFSCWAWKDLWRREDNHLFLDNRQRVNDLW